MNKAEIKVLQIDSQRFRWLLEQDLATIVRLFDQARNSTVKSIDRNMIMSDKARKEPW
jgi:hypothetical protein